MLFRIATLNLEQDHKCWAVRQELIVDQVREINPDFWALNEIHIPSQSGRWLQRAASQATGTKYILVQQSKAGEDGRMQGEGLLTRYPVIETANLDYLSHDCVALVARFEIAGRLLDIYVTHLIAAKVGDAARQYQVTQLLEWMRSRADADDSIVCGDFNAAPDQASIRLMAAAYHATQSEPTAFSPLREPGGPPTHPEWNRFDRCIDYLWISPSMKLKASGLCFDQPAKDNPDLWPSDHVGVWADLEIG
ncbi:MAG TPA: endonuclease/exonuclease/phosphatase family protein [Terriglobales bacterium]|jgi:endonuclease/exonuclease/phosphatase family metal-dependent hydrolase|nr:endonuclease/exonuclease/phosphatase family protein [Terriglobales bacterium]